MKLEVTTNLAPAAVVTEAVGTLGHEGWTIRALTENHLRLAGRRERATTPLLTFLFAVLAGFIAFVVALVVEPGMRVGDMHGGEVLAIYSVIAWPTALVAVLAHFLRTRGEAGVVVAALPIEGGAGSRVFAQAFGSAFAREELEAFLERIQREGEAAEPVRLVDRTER